MSVKIVDTVKVNEDMYQVAFNRMIRDGKITISQIQRVCLVGFLQAEAIYNKLKETPEGKKLCVRF